MLQKYYLVIFIIVLFLGFLYCGKESSNPSAPEPQKTAEELTSEGWQLYESHDYQNALTKFTQAISLNNKFADAMNGAGWAKAKLNQISEAISYFSECIQIDTLMIDAKAGLAFSYHTQNEYDLAIDYALEILQTNSNWTFSHNINLSASDLHLLLAICYFGAAEFDKSLQQVQILNPDFQTDITLPEGRSKLTSEIERLRGIV